MLTNIPNRRRELISRQRDSLEPPQGQRGGEPMEIPLLRFCEAHFDVDWTGSHRPSLRAECGLTLAADELGPTRNWNPLIVIVHIETRLVSSRVSCNHNVYPVGILKYWHQLIWILREAGKLRQTLGHSNSSKRSTHPSRGHDGLGTKLLSNVVFTPALILEE